MTIYVHEFLFRGRAPGSAEPPAWQVTLASTGTDGFGQPTRNERVLNMSQAAESGFDLAAIVGGLNAAALVENEALAASLAAAQDEIERLSAAEAPAEG